MLSLTALALALACATPVFAQAPAATSAKVDRVEIGNRVSENSPEIPPALIELPAGLLAGPGARGTGLASGKAALQTFEKYYM